MITETKTKTKTAFQEIIDRGWKVAIENSTGHIIVTKPYKTYRVPCDRAAEFILRLVREVG